MTLDHEIRFLSILRNFQRIPKSFAFWDPADWQAAKDYRQYVAHPMDLITVTKRIVSRRYKGNYLHFQKDVNRIWRNCSEYNGPNAPLTLDSKYMNQHFTKLLDSWIVSSSRPTDPDLRQ